MTKEEVVVAIGTDTSSIEKGLGIGRNYFAKWIGDLKTEEQKYSEWWNSELKKREEMEVASSVRAATRSNLARRLHRQRNDAQAAELAETIGQGSIPESWKKMSSQARESAGDAVNAFKEWGHETSDEISKQSGFFGFAFENSFHHTLKAMKKLVAINLVELGFQAKDYWDKFSLYMADAFYGNNSRAEALKERIIQSNTDFFHAANTARWEKQKADAKEREQMVEDAKKYLNLQDQINESINAQRKLKGGKDAELADANAIGKANLDIQEKTLELEEARKEGVNGRMKAAVAELAIEQDKLAILQVQTAQQQKQKEIEEETNLAKIRMADIQQRDREKYMPTLEELSHGGRFGSQARRIGRLDRQIKRDYEFGHTGQADKDIAARNKIYDSLADRGVVSERSEAREIKEIQAKLGIHIANIAEGKATIKVKPELK